jgi:sugar phosphate isomerase/epimerase
MRTNKIFLIVLLVLGLALIQSAARGQAAGDSTAAAAPVAAAPVAAHVDHNGLSKLGWQLAAGAQAFHDISFVEMIDLLHAQVFHHVELAPGQSLSPEKRDAKIGGEMAAAAVDALNAKLKAVRMDIVSYGVVSFTNNEADARKAFDFGKKLKVKNIVADPSTDSLEMLDKLAGEYAINVAIVNGVKGSAYADFDALTQAVSARSSRIGVCADLANWRRGGLVPLDCVKKLGARVIEVRLSDVNDQGEQVPLGAGTVNAEPALEYLKGQNFKGVFAVHYTQGSGQDLTNNFFRSVNAFSEIVSKLAGTHE